MGAGIGLAIGASDDRYLGGAIGGALLAALIYWYLRGSRAGLATMIAGKLVDELLLTPAKVVGYLLLAVLPAAALATAGSWPGSVLDNSGLAVGGALVGLGVGVLVTAKVWKPVTRAAARGSAALRPRAMVRSKQADEAAEQRLRQRSHSWILARPWAMVASSLFTGGFVALTVIVDGDLGWPVATAAGALAAAGVLAYQVRVRRRSHTRNGPV